MSATSQPKFMKDIFQYNNDVNTQLIDAIRNHHTILPEKAISLFSHIQNAHHIWNNRINNLPSKYTVFESHPIHLLEKLNQENHAQSINIIENFNLDTLITYTTSKGEIFSNSIRDILFHIINHSTYHRAQIAMIFRDAELSPIATDYISYARKMKNN